jgi:hypothetical protein
MNLASRPPRSPCSQTEIRSDGSDSTRGEPLDAVVLLAELLVLDLCVVRTAADLLRSSMSIEGGVALALAVILAASLARRVLRSRLRLPGASQLVPRVKVSRHAVR